MLLTNLLASLVNNQDSNKKDEKESSYETIPINNQLNNRKDE
jgi:hypothetical protein